MQQTTKHTVKPNEWLSVSDLNGKNGRVYNSGNSIIIYSIGQIKPDNESTDGNRIEEDYYFDYVVSGNESLWVTSLNSKGIISITENLRIAPIPIIQSEIARQDSTSNAETLEKILTELRIINAYNAMGFHEEITGEDL